MKSDNPFQIHECYRDEYGRACDPKTICRGHGQHYHCHICWQITGMLGHLRDDKHVCPVLKWVKS